MTSMHTTVVPCLWLNHAAPIQAYRLRAANLDFVTRADELEAMPIDHATLPRREGRPLQTITVAATIFGHSPVTDFFPGCFVKPSSHLEVLCG